MNIQKALGFFCATAWGVSAQAYDIPPSIVLYDGDVSVLEAPGVERVAVGNVEIISATMLKNEEVVVTAQKDGETTVHFWFDDGTRHKMSVVVAKANGYRQQAELKAMLANIPGLKIRTVGRQVVLEGRLSPEYLNRVKEAAKFYDNVLVLAEEQGGAATKVDSAEILTEVQAMLGQIPGIKIKPVGRQIVIDGDLHEIDMARIDLLKERYPDVLVLAQEMSEFLAPMIYFDVRITEFAKDDVEELGVNWSTNINGPTFAFNADGGTNNLYRGQFTGDTFKGLNAQVGDVGSHAYWGIASELTSRINLLEKNGSALTLASPRLSARSGGKAELTVGGQVPVVTSSINGPSVEYKDYGVMLNIAPQLYGSEMVSTHVMAEISQVDKANQVQGYPAFKTRRTENEVQLKVGETLVLSGLVSEDAQATVEGIAFLKDLPLIGGLFRNKSAQGKRTELVIFITPRLMTNGPGSVTEEAQKQQDEMIKKYQKSFGNIELID
ncbi:pilus assembly protein N-terminal domain-containing protein [Ectopseudomonas mendocina]|uniref:Pilus assembly protein N-terminal domain-containing protein n=1 Tax=Ectopseudomonas mendocina TaxID=300 RepID=A0ABZ2RGQ1_ECTME